MNRWTHSSLSPAGAPADRAARTVKDSVAEGWQGTRSSGFSLIAGVVLASVSVLICAVVMLASAVLGPREGEH